MIERKWVFIDYRLGRGPSMAAQSHQSPLFISEGLKAVTDYVL